MLERSAFMAHEVPPGAPKQRPDILRIFRARHSAVVRLSAFIAAFMERCGGRALCSLNHYNLDLMLAERGLQ